MLYVKRVQIMDHCAELIPEYLRFVRGVVDSSDLPLNVSREILQNNRQIGVIKKNITKKILDALAEMKKNDAPAYEKLHKEFGRVLKEGIHFDPSKKEEIADLLLFSSTKTEAGKYTTLSDYVRDMPIAQDAIYYITGRPDENILQSPYLEAFRTKGYEVLCLTDDIDDLIMLDLAGVQGQEDQECDQGRCEPGQDHGIGEGSAEGQVREAACQVQGALEGRGEGRALVRTGSRTRPAAWWRTRAGSIRRWRSCSSPWARMCRHRSGSWRSIRAIRCSRP